jgi:hypothetical protein
MSWGFLKPYLTKNLHCKCNRFNKNIAEMKIFLFGYSDKLIEKLDFKPILKKDTMSPSKKTARSERI